MFSVIIPLYNKAHYIEKAIDSVLSQTYGSFELIIINDGSTDNSVEVVREIDFSGIDVRIVDQKNKGVSATRNKGVEMAKYDYIAFLDADDWWEPDYLKEMQGLISEYPAAGIYGSGYYIVKNGKRRLAPIGVDTEFDRGEINYFQIYSKTLCMPLWTGAVVIPKAIFNENNGFNPLLKLGEDFYLWIHIAAKYPVGFINKPLSNYNQDVDITTRAVGARMYDATEHMIFYDYKELAENEDFHFLYEKLALYSLLPYYLSGRNEEEVDRILSQKINWKKHHFKYRIYYRLLPKVVVMYWFKLLSLASKIKRKVKQYGKDNY